MRGRETGTDDATRAMRFLVDRLTRLGLEPAGDSGFAQRVPMQKEVFGPGTTITVQQGGTARPVKIGTEIVPLLNLGAGVPPTKRTADGEIVFVGYGLQMANPKRDDFAGLSLQGKVVVVVNGAPAGVDSAKRAELEGQAAISQRLALIIPQRPAAVVILLAGKGTELFEQSAPQLERAVALRSNAPEVPESERQIPMIMLGIPVVGSPLLPTGWPADDKAQVLSGRRFTARIEQVKTPITGYNVAAVVRGSDPALNQTYLAFGAHYDHVGVIQPTAGDSIANGADDDGSGSMALLAIARVMQQAPVKPRRSVLFVWHVGEEKGLLGSSWFTDHPTVPIDSIVGEIDQDMVGRGTSQDLPEAGPTYLEVIGAKRVSREFGEILEATNAAQPKPFVFNYAYDAPGHPLQYYCRADHYNYARYTIPAVAFSRGEHLDYHQVTDEAQYIDYDDMARVTRFVYDAALRIANLDHRPAVDIPKGDPHAPCRQ
jgi:hypothetical protein